MLSLSSRMNSSTVLNILYFCVNIFNAKILFTNIRISVFIKIFIYIIVEKQIYSLKLFNIVPAERKPANKIEINIRHPGLPRVNFRKIKISFMTL